MLTLTLTIWTRSLPSAGRYKLECAQEMRFGENCKCGNGGLGTFADPLNGDDYNSDEVYISWESADIIKEVLRFTPLITSTAKNHRVSIWTLRRTFLLAGHFPNISDTSGRRLLDSLLGGNFIRRFTNLISTGFYADLCMGVGSRGALLFFRFLGNNFWLWGIESILFVFFGLGLLVLGFKSCPPIQVQHPDDQSTRWVIWSFGCYMGSL